MNTLVVLSEEAVAHSEPAVPPWVFGAVAFVVLMLLLFLVTRFDPNR